jgi:hypothetical protein
MDIYKCPKFISLFYFWEFFSHFYKREKPIATIYAVVAEIIIRITRPCMVTDVQTN